MVKPKGSLLTLVVAFIIGLLLMILGAWKLYATYRMRGIIDSARNTIDLGLYDVIYPTWLDYIFYVIVVVAGLVLFIWGIYQYFRSPDDDLKIIASRIRKIDAGQKLRNDLADIRADADALIEEAR